MLWSCNSSWILSIFLAAAIIAAGCSNKLLSPTTKSKEFEHLEDSLIRLAQSPEADWIDALDTIRKMNISSKEISEIRNLCVSAYDAFGEATVKLKAARLNVNKTDQAITSKAPNAPKTHAEAKRSTEAVSKALDKAEALVKSCALKRQEQRNRLAGHR